MKRPRNYRRHWCGDDYFRGCILREALEGLGLRVLIPARRPNPATGKLPRKDSTFSHSDIVSLLESMGDADIRRVYNSMNSEPRGRGDIDLLALHGGTILVAEVKTRLIPYAYKRFGPKPTELMIRYHISPPSDALRDWITLEKLRVLDRRNDNPNSIAELARAAAAAHAMISSRSSRGLVVGLVSHCAINMFRRTVISSLERTASYLERLGLPIRGYALITLVHRNIRGVPREVTVECVGGGCSIAGIPGEAGVRLSLSDCPPAGDCASCAYRRVCPILCAAGRTRRA